jgi:SAM-dependent methyltransferase
VRADLWGGTYKKPAVWAETARALIGLADLRPGMRVLDVGSAGGGTLFPALERIGETGSIVGIEVEEDWVEWLSNEIAKRGIRNAENLQMNGQSMSFPDASFDAVIVGLVGLDEDYDFEAGRVINGAPLLREVFRALRPGGFVYESNWLWQDDSEWMGELVRRRLPDCSKRGYFPGTENGYVALLRFAGFEDVRVASFEGRYTFDAPAEWMACVGPMWEEELERIKKEPRVLEAFERDAFGLLAGHTDDEGRIAYERSAILVSARKPGSP